MNESSKALSNFHKILFVTFLSLMVMAINGLQAEDQDKGGSYICSKKLFAYELGGDEWLTDEPSPNSWFFHQEAPNKYRILAKLPIYLTYTILNRFTRAPTDSLYYSYLIWSSILLSFFLYQWGKLAEHFISSASPYIQLSSNRVFYLATLLLCVLPPILFSFKFPVHNSPNDFLGYALIALSLLALAKGKLGLFTCYTAIGIFCRETNLIVLFPFWAMPPIKGKRKELITGGLILLFVAYRLAWSGKYNPLDAAAHNLLYPFESLLFLLMVFGPFWSLGVLGQKKLNSCELPGESLPVILGRTFYLATLAVLAIVICLARIREIRIEFILFFYFVPFGIYYIMVRWPHWTTPDNITRVPVTTLISGGISLTVYFTLLAGNMQTHPQRMNLLQSFFDSFGGGWAKIFACYLFISLFLIIYDLISIYWPKTERSEAD